METRVHVHVCYSLSLVFLSSPSLSSQPHIHTSIVSSCDLGGRLDSLVVSALVLVSGCTMRKINNNRQYEIWRLFKEIWYMYMYMYMCVWVGGWV